MLLSIKALFECLEQLNFYLMDLPCLYDSPRATGNTKVVSPFDEAKMAEYLLRMCPMAWYDQYNLIEKYMPQDLWSLLPTLKSIEKSDLGKNSSATKAACDNKLGNNKKTGSNNGKKCSTNIADIHVPHKNQRTKKYCASCEKHGGVHPTHNTV